jgi:hypothetical protein
MYIRISKGHYKPELHAEVTARLDASSKRLIPAIGVDFERPIANYPVLWQLPKV